MRFPSQGGTAIGVLNQYLAAPRPAAGWPHRVGAVPPRAASFQHRAEVERLRAAVTGGGTAVLGQVLTGTGGVGKTQLAADYAHTEQERGALDVVVWVTAAGRTAVVSVYAQAAAELCETAPPDAGLAAEAFLAWLAPRPDGPRWLVVLDDVAQPADLAGLWPPANPRGQTVVTTRRRDDAFTGPAHRHIGVGMFTEAESAGYLTAALTARARQEPAADLAALAADLGHLPLALSQAVSYLIDADLSVAEYRAHLADRRTRLPELLPEPGALPDQQRHTVAAAWTLSVDRADTMRPAGLARPLLDLLAQLDPNGIPISVLAGDPALGFLAAARREPDGVRPDGPDGEASAAVREGTVREAAQGEAAAATRSARREEAQGEAAQGEVAQGEVGQALRVLHRLSLIDHTSTTPHQAVRVHQLLQRALRDQLPDDRRASLARGAADALMAAWPDIENDTGLGPALRANTASLTRHGEEALFSPVVHPVLFRAGRSLGEAGQAAAARDYFSDLATRAARHLGPDHRDTLTARNNIAGWRGEAGDVAGAVGAFVALLPDLERVLGPDHIVTLATRTNLASRRGDAGDPPGAAAALATLLADLERVLGPDHPRTLGTRNNLAYWRAEAGDHTGAANAFATLLTDLERILGPDHPHTLATRNNLASRRGDAGDPSGAAAAVATVLADQLRILGPDHPSTLGTRNNLAYWRGEAGDHTGAANAFATLLTDLEHILGPDHPHTLATRNNLAYWRGEAGDPTGAADAFATLLTDQLRVLGPDHPSTLTTRGHLAFWSGQAGAPAEAADAFAALLTDELRVLGPDHPSTLTTRARLAYLLGQAGDPAGAADAFVTLLTDLLRVLGPGHPHTRAARDNLTYWHAKAAEDTGKSG